GIAGVNSKVNISRAAGGNAMECPSRMSQPSCNPKVFLAMNARRKRRLYEWFMINSERKINCHVPACCAGGFLVPVLKGVSEIKPCGKPLAITQAYASPGARKRAGGIVDHATRVVIVSDPSKIEENKGPQIEPPEIDKSADIGTEPFQVKE